ncbi:MAG: hypothetical protein ACKO2C_10525 [Actinomycetes bacterium]
MESTNTGRRGEYVLRIPVRARPGHTGEILRCSGFGPMMVGTNSWVLEVPGDDAGEAIVVSNHIFERIFTDAPAGGTVIDLTRGDEVASASALGAAVRRFDDPPD